MYQILVIKKRNINPKPLKDMLFIFKYSLQKNYYIFLNLPLYTSGKFLLEPVNELSKKPPDHWNDNDLMLIVKLLVRNPWINRRGENYDFDMYLNKYDNICELVDLIYVVAKAVYD